jgi:prepilin peptidase CpaA
MVAQVILIVWAAVAAAIDVRYRRLPNWLTLGGLLAGGLYALVTGTSMLGGNPANAMFAAAIGFLALFPAYLAGWMGAGDVKLFAAMGILGGGKVLLPTLVIGSLVTGIGALVFIVLKNKLALVNVPTKRPLPFGVGLALGFALSVLDIFPMLDWKG